MNEEELINFKLEQLKKSKFRGSFKLSQKDIEYIKNKGWDTIKRHAYDFIEKRLAPAEIPNDGKQTPWRGHPVFVAQHATGCCCRGCLFKWHRIEKGKQLDKKEEDYIVNLIMAWLKTQFYA